MKGHTSGSGSFQCVRMRYVMTLVGSLMQWRAHHLGIATALQQATVCAVMAVPAGGEGQEPPVDECHQPGSRTLLESSEGRVVLVPGSGARFTVLCPADNGPVGLLDAPSEDIWAYRPPAMAIAGGTVGFARDDAGDGDRLAAFTAVGRFDFRLGTQKCSWPISTVRRTGPRVGSVVVAADGALAWIVCRYNGFAKGRSSPGCVRPGRFDRVIAVGSRSEHRKVLDEGRDIDPSSLRRAGTRLSWKRGGKRRTAKLP